MTKNEKVISDMELDMVVGGASALFLKEREDGKLDGFLVSGNGDMEAAKKLLKGGAVQKIGAKLSVKLAQGIRREKLEAYIEKVKKVYPDLEVGWLK